MSLWRKLVILVVAVVVVALVAASLGITTMAFVERIKIGRGTSQMIDIVDLSRRVPEFDHDVGKNGRDDLLLRLDRVQQLKATGEQDGLKTVSNPWDGSIVSFTTDANIFRVETEVPSLICTRMIDLMTKNVGSLGLQQINVRGKNEAWRQIFSRDAAREKPSERDLAAGCRSDNRVTVALTFTLR